jgi:hypothetical protein
MVLRKIAAVLTAVVLASSAALAFQTASPNVTGTWSGTLTFAADGGKVESAYMVLKQEGTTVSGSAGPNADRQYAIEKVKFVSTKEGTTLGFTVPAGSLVIVFDLKLVEGKLKGTAVGDREGDRRTADVELKTVK